MVRREYLAALLGYLESFHQRTQPLTSLDKVHPKHIDTSAGGLLIPAIHSSRTLRVRGAHNLWAGLNQ